MINLAMIDVTFHHNGAVLKPKRTCSVPFKHSLWQFIESIQFFCAEILPWVNFTKKKSYPGHSSLKKNIAKTL